MKKSKWFLENSITPDKSLFLPSYVLGFLTAAATIKHFLLESRNTLFKNENQLINHGTRIRWFTVHLLKKTDLVKTLKTEYTSNLAYMVRSLLNHKFSMFTTVKKSDLSTCKPFMHWFETLNKLKIRGRDQNPSKRTPTPNSQKKKCY